MTWEIYLRTPDAVILASYLAPHDDDGRLISEGERRALRWAREKRELTGHPDRAALELPSAESLDIPAEVMADGFPSPSRPHGVPQDYMLAVWSVFRRQKLTPEQAMQMWRKAVPLDRAQE